MRLMTETELQGNLKPSELIKYIEMHIALYGDNSVCFMTNDGEAKKVNFYHSDTDDGALFITLEQHEVR